MSRDCSEREAGAPTGKPKGKPKELVPHHRPIRARPPFWGGRCGGFGYFVRSGLIGNRWLVPVLVVARWQPKQPMDAESPDTTTWW